MRLAPDGLEKLKRESKAVSPDFTSFDKFNSGAPFIHHEDGWKRKASDYATEHLAQKGKIWRRLKDFVGALNGVILNARKLALNDQFSGIAWNEDRAALIRNKAHARQLGMAIYDLLYERADLVARVQQVADVREKLTTLLLMLVHREKFVFVKPKQFNTLLRTLAIRSVTEPTPEEVVRTQEFATAVRAALPAVLGAPRDMIDVQSFICVAAGTYTRKPARLPGKLANACRPTEAGEIDDDCSDGITLHHYKKDQAYEGLRLRVEAGHVPARTCLEAGFDSARPIHGRLASLHAE